jgi:hypothetical protein
MTVTAPSGPAAVMSIWESEAAVADGETGAATDTIAAPTLANAATARVMTDLTATDHSPPPVDRSVGCDHMTGARIEHQPALDGVRAWSVLAVLCFHGEVPGFSGGYLGSRFFVIRDS